ncbi:MAG: hypothetical protein Q7J84_14895 [Sulfuricaulis sp.]|nr:hypothetical protein [Sulfuricaulis sp.]
MSVRVAQCIHPVAPGPFQRMRRNTLRYCALRGLAIIGTAYRKNRVVIAGQHDLSCAHEQG